ncbi:cytochrome c oxidase subunit III [Stappia sp. 22II-S9-Z10]|nr:cytochrome c oxidase subunit III [Stappia sp. 22II-S9-Z10]
MSETRDNPREATEGVSHAPSRRHRAPRHIPLRMDVDATDLTRSSSHTHPLWWGVLLVVLIEATVVATLLTSYFYLRSQAQDWPPPGIDPPDLLWPTIVLVILPASSYTMWWAGKGGERGSKAVLAWGTGLSVSIACLALALRGLTFASYDVRWDEHAYGSMLWIITGFHFTHIASAAVGTAVVTLLALMNFYNPHRQVSVVVDTLYWYFVAFVFLPIYLVLYISPRIL